MITPWLKSIARITLWSVIKTAVSFSVFVGAAGWVVWKGWLAKEWVEDVEYEANVDAEKALEDLDGENEKKKEEDKKEKEEGKDKKEADGKGKKK